MSYLLYIVTINHAYGDCNSFRYVSNRACLLVVINVAAFRSLWNVGCPDNNSSNRLQNDGNLLRFIWRWYMSRREGHVFAVKFDKVGSPPHPPPTPIPPPSPSHPHPHPHHPPPPPTTHPHHPPPTTHPHPHPHPNKKNRKKRNTDTHTTLLISDWLLLYVKWQLVASVCHAILKMAWIKKNGSAGRVLTGNA